MKYKHDRSTPTCSKTWVCNNTEWHYGSLYSLLYYECISYSLSDKWAINVYVVELHFILNLHIVQQHLLEQMLRRLAKERRRVFPMLQQRPQMVNKTVVHSLVKETQDSLPWDSGWESLNQIERITFYMRPVSLPAVYATDGGQRRLDL